MNLICSSIEIWDQEPTLVGAYKIVERAGRLCYKSEDKITEDSYLKFVEMLKKSGHLSVLEHGTLYLTRIFEPLEDSKGWTQKYQLNPYSEVEYLCTKGNLIYAFVTTNLRVILENDWEEDIAYITEPTEYHKKRITVHMICDRGVGNEVVRHRKLSFSQESSRFCNYSLNKFNNEITCILPPWIEDIEDKSYENLSAETVIFLESLLETEKSYFTLLDKGWKPEQARNVLPLALKTEIAITGFESDWEAFFELRTSPRAHPQIRELAIELQNKLKNEL